MRRLPDHAVSFHFKDEGRTVAVGAHEADGYVFWTRIDLFDFAQNFASLEDLETAILATVDILAASSPLSKAKRFRPRPNRPAATGIARDRKRSRNEQSLQPSRNQSG